MYCMHGKPQCSLIRILLGVDGTIYEEHTISALRSLGIKGHTPGKLLRDLRRHAVQQLHAIYTASSAGTVGKTVG